MYDKYKELRLFFGLIKYLGAEMPGILCILLFYCNYSLQARMRQIQEL
jgi:hypothetical protein